MARKALRLGDLQLQILRVLWERGPSTVAEVQAALDRGNDLAYTTVATMLRKMEARQLVRHRVAGRRFVYSAVVASGDVTRSMANDLVDRLFEGSLSTMVYHLLTTRDVSREELDRLRQLIDQHRQSKG
jgi:predicted transcriptional regulator